MTRIGLYLYDRTDPAETAMVSQAGAVGLVETVRVAGHERELSQALERWRQPNGRHG